VFLRVEGGGIAGVGTYWVYGDTTRKGDGLVDCVGGGEGAGADSGGGEGEDLFGGSGVRRSCM